jgi:hypothetical protein
MDEKDEKEDYEIGYGKPPPHTQFKKGQSGNPKGRSIAKSESFADAIQKELDTKLYVREGGKLRKISKRRCIVKNEVIKALKGDRNSTAFLVRSGPRESEFSRGLPPMIQGLRAMHAKHEAADAASAKNKAQEGEDEEDA